MLGQVRTCLTDHAHDNQLSRTYGKGGKIKISFWNEDRLCLPGLRVLGDHDEVIVTFLFCLLGRVPGQSQINPVRHIQPLESAVLLPEVYRASTVPV
jgi:hypothetical protein